MTRLLLLIYLLPVCALAQREVYVTDRQVPISKEEYDKEETQEYFYLDFKTEQLTVHVKAKRILKGQLSTEKFREIKTFLTTESEEELSNSDVIVINYSPGKDRCISTGSTSAIRSYHKALGKKLSAMENVAHFYVCKEPSANEIYGKRLQWLTDSQGILEDPFFTLHYPCGSFVLIDPKGRYYCYRGEYGTSTIIELLGNTEETFERTK